MTAPILRVRYKLTPDQARQLDEAQVRQALNGRAHRLYLERETVRETRARIQGMTHELDPEQALELWMRENEISEALRPAVIAAHRAFASEVGA